MGKILFIPGADFSQNGIPSKFGISKNANATKKIRTGVTAMGGNWNGVSWTNEVITPITFDKDGYAKVPDSFDLGESAIGAFACDTGSSSAAPIGGDVVKIWNLSALDTSEVQTMLAMFAYNTELVSLIVPFNTEKLNDCQQLFRGCAKLEKLDLSTWTIGHHHNSQRMFQGCSALKEIKFGEGYNPVSAGYDSNTFNGCTNLADIYAPAVTASEYQTSGTGAYVLVTNLTGLADSGTCPIITIHCANGAKLVYTKAENTWAVE